MDSQVKTVYETLSVPEREDYKENMNLLDNFIKDLIRLKSSGELIKGNLDSLIFNRYYKIKEINKHNRWIITFNLLYFKCDDK